VLLERFEGDAGGGPPEPGVRIHQVDAVAVQLAVGCELVEALVELGGGVLGVEAEAARILTLAQT